MKSFQIVLSTVAFAAVSAGASIASASDYLPAPELEKVVSTMSRDEVRAEILDAVHSGKLGRTDADMERISAQSFQSLKTRAQVVEETREAARLGMIPRTGHDQDSLSPTSKQQRQITQAGLRTLAVDVAFR